MSVRRSYLVLLLFFIIMYNKVFVGSGLMNYEFLIYWRDKLLIMYNRASKSMKERILYDISFYNHLVTLFGLENKLFILNREIISDEKLLNPSVSLASRGIEELEYFSTIADEVLGVYKSEGVIGIGTDANPFLSPQDQKDILREFFNWFCPKLEEIYQDLIDKGRIIEVDTSASIFGFSILAPVSGEYILGKDRGCKTSLSWIETCVHELMHIYSAKFLMNYRFSGFENMLSGFFSETISMLAELELYRFYTERHICYDAANLHAHINDLMYLRNYKSMKYLSILNNRDDAYMNVSPDGYGYIVWGNIDVNIPGEEPLYGNYKNYDDISVEEFIYAMSLIDAYNLEERIVNGEKNVINNYLIDFQWSDKLEERKQKALNLDYMRHSIRKHQEGVNRIYRLK